MAILIGIASRLLWVKHRKLFVGPVRFEDLDGLQHVEWGEATRQAFGLPYFVEFGVDCV